MWLVMISPLKIHIQTQNFGTEIVVVVVVKQGISMAWSWLQICFIIENVTLRIHSGVVTLQVYFTSISVGTKAGVQVSKREFHTHIHLDYTIIEFLSCILKNKNKNRECVCCSLSLSLSLSIYIYIYIYSIEIIHNYLLHALYKS